MRAAVAYCGPYRARIIVDVVVCVKLGKVSCCLEVLLARKICNARKRPEISSVIPPCCDWQYAAKSATLRTWGVQQFALVGVFFLAAKIGFVRYAMRSIWNQRRLVW